MSGCTSFPSGRFETWLAKELTFALSFMFAIKLIRDVEMSGTFRGIRKCL